MSTAKKKKEDTFEREVTTGTEITISDSKSNFKMLIIQQVNSIEMQYGFMSECEAASAIFTLRQLMETFALRLCRFRESF